MNLLEEFSKSNIKIIADTAKKVSNYKILLQTGEITQQEFEDLVLDCTRLEVIDSELYDFEVKAKINAALTLLGNIKLIVSI